VCGLPIRKRSRAPSPVQPAASGDYEQLAMICHRVLVMRFGRVTAELSGEQLTETGIAHAAHLAEADIA